MAHAWVTEPAADACLPVQKKKNRLSMTWWVAAATGLITVALAVSVAADQTGVSTFMNPYHSAIRLRHDMAAAKAAVGAQ